MSLRIRMARGGAKKRPYYRIVVADARSPRDGRFIERIGSYNPMLGKDDPDRVKLDLDRAKHWLSVGAQPSDRVGKFLASAGVLDARTISEQTKQHLPRKKTLERMEAQKEAAEAAAEAAAAAAETAAADAATAEAAAAETAAAEAAAAEAAAEAPVEEAAPEAAAEEAPAEEAADAGDEKKSEDK